TAPPPPPGLRALGMVGGKQVEVALRRVPGVAEPPQAEQGLAQRSMGLGHPGVEGDGLLKVIDLFVQRSPGGQGWARWECATASFGSIRRAFRRWSMASSACPTSARAMPR